MLNVTNDLPPRTWRHWWLAWPKWFRIACYAGLVLAAGHVAVGIWILIGLWEPESLADLRERGADVEYFWESETSLVPRYQEIMSVLYGKGWRSVVEINLNGKATDADVRRIAANCPALKRLSLRNTEVSAAAIAELAKLPRLEELDLRGTNATDESLSQFGKLDRLTSLYLFGTLVSDQSMPVLASLPHLYWVDLQHTDVTKSKIDTWRTERKNQIVTERDQYPEPVLGFICWSDGERAGNFRGKFEVHVEGPLNSPKLRQRRQKGKSLSRDRLWWRDARFNSRGDGDYRFTLKLGAMESEPALVSVTNRQPSQNPIEFHMPCTKAEALQSAKIEN